MHRPRIAPEVQVARPPPERLASQALNQHHHQRISGRRHSQARDGADHRSTRGGYSGLIRGWSPPDATRASNSGAAGASSGTDPAATGPASGPTNGANTQRRPVDEEGTRAAA